MSGKHPVSPKVFNTILHVGIGTFPCDPTIAHSYQVDIIMVLTILTQKLSYQKETKKAVRRRVDFGESSDKII